MKKNLLALGLSIMTLTSIDVHAQFPAGMTVPDFTLTDINGNTHNLYSYLEAGKTVIMDFSTTWCGPCWGYHQSHALKEIYLKHGPTGTCSQDAIVLFIEADPSTPLSCLYGPDPDCSFGDWTEGTPYPIINLDSSATTDSILSTYGIIGFPTLVRVCPDKKAYEFDYFTQGAPSKIEEGIGSCAPVVNDLGIVKGGSSMSCGTSLTPSVEITNSGTATITSGSLQYSIDGGAPLTYNYTGSLAPAATAVVTFPEVTGLTTGFHTVDVNVISANGVPDEKQINNCFSYKTYANDAVVTAEPYTQDFSSTDAFPYNNWVVINPDDLITWQRMSNDSIKSLYINNYNYDLSGRVDEVIMQPIDLTSLTAPSFSFDVAYAPYAEGIYDRLEIHVSDDCGANWTLVYAKQDTDLATADATESEFFPNATQWRKETIDFAPYAGKNKVFIKFVNINGWANNIYIDNIMLNNTTSIADDKGSEAKFTLSPNPVKGEAVITANLDNNAALQVSVVDITGKQVIYPKAFNAEKGLNSFRLNTANLPNGAYTIIINDGTKSQFIKMIK